MERINSDFLTLTLDERILWLKERYRRETGMFSAFGYSGMILMHRLKDLWSDIDIFFINTRLHFHDTLRLVERVRAEWGLRIEAIEAAESEAEIESLHGADLWNRNPDLCCHIRKVVPMHSILPSKQIWINALRRDQSPTRKELDFYVSDADNRHRIFPLVDWTREQCWAYIHENRIFYNPLHDRSYPSIGCRVCTAPVPQGREERHGRWQSFSKTECGLHSALIQNSTKAVPSTSPPLI